MHVAPIDLQPFREGNDADRRAVAAQFDAAGRDSGFFAVTGHGVDQALLDEMLAVTTAFFDLPVEEKMACYVEDRTANRGYAPEGTEALAYSLGETDLPLDLFEAYNVGRELTPEQLADPYYSTHRDLYFARQCVAGRRRSVLATPGSRTGRRSRTWRWTSWMRPPSPSGCPTATSGRTSTSRSA